MEPLSLPSSRACRKCGANNELEFKFCGNCGAEVGAAPSYRLYDAGSIFTAAFFGGPLAGSIAMSWNYSRLGKNRPAVISVLLGIVATVVLVAIGIHLASSMSYVVGICAVFVTVAVARALQGEALAQHARDGGLSVSRWSAAGMGLGVAAFLSVFIYIAIVVAASR